MSRYVRLSNYAFHASPAAKRRLLEETALPPPSQNLAITSRIWPLARRGNPTHSCFSRTYLIGRFAAIRTTRCYFSRARTATIGCGRRRRSYRGASLGGRRCNLGWRGFLLFLNAHIGVKKRAERSAKGARGGGVGWGGAAGGARGAWAGNEIGRRGGRGGRRSARKKCCCMHTCMACIYGVGGRCFVAFPRCGGSNHAAVDCLPQRFPRYLDIAPSFP